MTPVNQNTLPSFRETRHGFESLSTDGQHTYVIAFNSIDYDVTHYWAQNPQGELIEQTSDLGFGFRIARNHYAADTKV
jgi:hypothetical protein